MKNRKFFLLVLFILAICGILFLWSLFWTGMVVRALRTQQLNTASRSAQRASLFISPLSSATQHKSAIIEIWRLSLEEVRLLAEAETLAPAVVHSLTTLPDSSTALTAVPRARVLFANITQNAILLQQYAQQSFVIRHFFKQELVRLSDVVTYLQDAQILFQEITTDTQSILFLFQNSDELRATGGFMGSFAEFRWQDGQLIQDEIQDIYEPDGQFQGFLQAPPGVDEYLSGGRGWRLPDANWSPNVPDAAATILQFFSAAGRTRIQHVVFLNSEVIEEVLRAVDGVYLPSARTKVTAENFTTLARADRSQFFAGSQQKRVFLSSVFTQLKLKLENLSSSQKRALLKLLWQKLETKDLQLYSSNPQLQHIARAHAWSGEIHTTPGSLFFFPIESNVGINKANKAIERSVRIEKKGDLLHISLSINNHNSRNAREPAIPPLTKARPLDYVNYQRFFFPTTAKLQNIQIDGSEVSPSHVGVRALTLPEATIAQVQEIGVLFLVPAESEHTISFTLSLPPDLAQQNTLQLFKQSGTGSIPYQIEWDGALTNLLLEKDLELPLSNR